MRLCGRRFIRGVEGSSASTGHGWPFPLRGLDPPLAGDERDPTGRSVYQTKNVGVRLPGRGFLDSRGRLV